MPELEAAFFRATERAWGAEGAFWFCRDFRGCRWSLSSVVYVLKKD